MPVDDTTLYAAGGALLGLYIAYKSANKHNNITTVGMCGTAAAGAMCASYVVPLFQN